jgi:hypothetical protein
MSTIMKLHVCIEAGVGAHLNHQYNSHTSTKERTLFRTEMR